jgi:hypothetical protein
MNYEIDNNFTYEYHGSLPIIPSGATEDENELIVLPNGKYMPPGIYFDKKSGLEIIYEPYELSFAGMVERCVIKA